MNNDTLKIRLTGDNLKIIAAIAMFIDHAAYGLLYFYLSTRYMDILPQTYTNLNKLLEACRGIGRIAFPIFCFLLVEGFVHTRNRYKYAARLFWFAIITELTFDLALFHESFHLEYQNTLFTLFLGLIMLILIEYIESKLIGLSTSVKYICIVCTVAGFCELSQLLKTDYAIKGIILIAALYLFRSNKALRNLLGAAIFSYEKFAPIAFLLLYFYDPDVKPRLKYFFYLFYPAHLILIYLAGLLLFQ